MENKPEASESVDLSNLDEKIKTTPYNDAELKKSINHIHLFAIFSILLIYGMSILFTVSKVYLSFKLSNLRSFSMISTFYFSIFSAIIIELILISSLILILIKYHHLTDYKKVNFIIRTVVYVVIITLFTLFLFTGLFIGDSLAEEYHEVKYFDDVYIPSMINIIDNAKLGNEDIYQFQSLTKNYFVEKNIEFEEYTLSSEEVLNDSLDSFTIIVNLSDDLINEHKQSKFIDESVLLEINSGAYKKINLTLIYFEILEATKEAQKASLSGDDLAFNDAKKRIDKLALKEQKIVSELKTGYINNLND
ncbi:MAG: hypothetical protein KKE20_00635 [Nanoarchaeota archaeon]|nr:hypothetical protein [Nanoarchaeota archaeon]